MKNLLITIGLILLALLMTSCGARKSKVSKIETEVKKDLVIDTKNNVTKLVTIDSTSTEVKETVIYTPIDPNKPSKANGEEFINTSIKKEKTSLKTAKKTKAKSVDKTRDKITHKEETSVKIKEKDTDKEQFNPFVLLWLIIPLGIIFYLLKRYTNIFKL